ncbi:MAG: PspA-associated protein PspAA [Solirubrobacteraceae bacterium]
MIVRISGEDQFRIDESLHAELNQLDATVVQAVESGDEATFKSAFPALLDFVRANGTIVGDDEIETSDLILPPDDLTFAEAGEEFTGEGLIPD